jgi:hypothetical protein
MSASVIGSHDESGDQYRSRNGRLPGPILEAQPNSWSASELPCTHHLNSLPVTVAGRFQETRGWENAAWGCTVTGTGQMLQMLR